MDFFVGQLCEMRKSLLLLPQRKLLFCTGEASLTGMLMKALAFREIEL
jgi:hypothetical protein